MLHQHVLSTTVVFVSTHLRIVVHNKPTCSLPPSNGRRQKRQVMKIWLNKSPLIHVTQLQNEHKLCLDIHKYCICHKQLFMSDI
jgi:hypothetical protein